MKRLRALLTTPPARLVAATILLLIVATPIALVSLGRAGAHSGAHTIPASEAAAIIKSGRATAVLVQTERAFVTADDGEYVFIKDREAPVSQMLANFGVSSAELSALSYAVEETSPVVWSEILPLGLVTVLAAGFLIITLRRGPHNGALGFGRSRARLFVGQAQNVSFDDVAGVAEAKEELVEIVEFLKSPEKFTAMGARIPKGVLLVGPPGTGKTLVSRAVAGEAGVPFFSISGSEFVEMFVGVGASRVRDLFAQAKKQAPSIIFVDEIDAVGRRRSVGNGAGAHDEREQTLNQILVEMDGFEGDRHVIVLAATNRPDVLDPALLRPGRFDRQVTLANPDVKERTAILGVHARNKPLSRGVRLDVLARSTPGFSGADLANLVNEGAILAVRKGRKAIEMLDLQEAIDRVIAGPQKKARVMSALEQRRTAYHEGGHAVVGRFSANHDPVHKVTIISRGRMGGYTRFLPEEDRYYMTRAQFEAQIASALGGWVAERLIFGDVSTGASNDIEKATSIARNMVTTYGMSEIVGPLALSKADGGIGYSERIAEAIDAEVRNLIDAAAAQAEAVLVRHREVLDALAARLLESETVEGDDLEQIFSGAAEGADGVVTPLPTYRHRPTNGAGRLALPRTANGLASTTLSDEAD